MSNEINGKSLKQYYLDFCKEQKITPNSVFKNLLPEDAQKTVTEEILDFNKNFVGDRGFQAIISIIKFFPNLKEIRIKHNGLRNKSIISLMEMLKTNLTIEKIDLSDNFISQGAAIAIINLLKEKKILKEIKIEGTKIEMELKVKIINLLKKNN